MDGWMDGWMDKNWLYINMDGSWICRMTG